MCVRNITQKRALRCAMAALALLMTHAVVHAAPVTLYFKAERGARVGLPDTILNGLVAGGPGGFITGQMTIETSAPPVSNSGTSTFQRAVYGAEALIDLQVDLGIATLRNDRASLLLVDDGFVGANEVDRIALGSFDDTLQSRFDIELPGDVFNNDILSGVSIPQTADWLQLAALGGGRAFLFVEDPLGVTPGLLDQIRFDSVMLSTTPFPAPVPLPAGLGLLLSALGLAAGFGRLPRPRKG